MAAGSLLLAAALACGGRGPNVEATVNAVSTAVEQTLAAMTQPPGAATQPPPSPTAPSATQPAEATTAPPPTETAPASAAPSATLPVSELARPNGPVIHATRRAQPPTIDAQIEDWPGALPYAIDQIVFQPTNWSGTGDQSATFDIGWDANYLYLLVNVVDDVHVQTANGEVLYRGDSLELQLDADLAGDFGNTRIDGDDYQLGLSPGADRQTPELYLWNPPASNGVPSGVQVASRPTGETGGYVIEVAIPWSMYGLVPAAGNRYGFAFNSSDNDSPGTAEQQSMISTVVTRTLLDPTTWGTLALDP